MHNTWYLTVSKKSNWQPFVFWIAIAALVIVSLMISLITLHCMIQRRKYIWLVKAVLPSKVVKVLKRGHSYNERFKCVTVLFSDIVSYTDLSASVDAIEVVKLLNELYGKYDTLVDDYGCVKIETIGDAFMAASGIHDEPPHEGAARITRLAVAMLKATKETKFNGRCIRIRVGIHSGPAVGAVIGFKVPHFCLCGDTINTASRMETNSEPYRIHVSAVTANLLAPYIPSEFYIEPRGTIDVKGKGKMYTYWVEDKRENISIPQSTELIKMNFDCLEGIKIEDL